MATVTTTLVSGQSATVGAVSSRASALITVTSGQTGPTGNTGANGISVTGANVVSNNLILTFSNSATLNVGTVVGAIGNTGPTGNTGVSVTAANVASGNLIITLSNTSTIDAGSVATNVAAPYSWTNTHSFSNTVTINGDLTVGNTSVNVAITSTAISGNATGTFGNTTINGTLTATGNVAGNTAGFAIGYRDVPQNFTNTSFTLALTDAGKHILTQNTGSSTQTITIANNTSVAFQTGAAISIVVQSTGTVAVANGAGVTMYLAGNSTAKSTVTLNSYSMATLLKIGTNTWMVSGTGAT